MCTQKIISVNGIYIYNDKETKKKEMNAIKEYKETHVYV